MYENGRKIMETFFDEEAEKPLSSVVPEDKKSERAEVDLENPFVFDEAAAHVNARLTKFISEKSTAK